MDNWLTAENLGYMTDAVAEWLAYGIGLGAVVWCIGQVVAIIFRFVRY